MSKAAMVITDSGGMQEETTILGIPCLTVRRNTERPVTITDGTNTLVGNTASGILKGFNEHLSGPPRNKRPKLWDGKASIRIAKILKYKFSQKNIENFDSKVPAGLEPALLNEPLSKFKSE